jgi:hypothetical protein
LLAASIITDLRVLTSGAWILAAVRPFLSERLSSLWQGQLMRL